MRSLDEFLAQIKQRYARRLTGDDDRVLTVILDGENAWSAYREDARPFLHALYQLLEHDAEVESVKAVSDIIAPASDMPSITKSWISLHFAAAAGIPHSSTGIPPVCTGVSAGFESYPQVFHRHLVHCP